MNGTDTDAVAVLVQGDVGKRAIYVRAQETGIMTSIPIGEYRLQFQRGSRWLDTRRFCVVTATSEFTDTVEFYEVQEADGTKFNNLSVSLHAVPQGNAHTTALSENSFRLPPEEPSLADGTTLSP